MARFRFAGLLVLAAIGCGPDAPDEVPEDAAERYADAMCETHERCSCFGEGFADAASCRAESIDTFERVKDLPTVEFDESCFEDVLDFIEDNDCAAPPNTDSVPCEVFRGATPRGDTCASDWSFGGSAGGLTSGPCGSGVCSLGRCIDPPAVEVGLGEPCHLELGVRCGQGVYCDSLGVCRAEVPLGQPCDTPAACDDGYCAGLATSDVGVCTLRIDAGDTCDDGDVMSCAPGYTAYCSDEGTCAEEWPMICQFISPPGDFYDARDWVPF